MIVEDKTKVKAVHFKYPEMMNENAQEEIKNDYNELLSLKRNSIVQEMLLESGKINLQKRKRSLKKRLCYVH